ncbi:hypothetical protein B7494_g75 [Chlorociboria aeruginascens]|nr:hypothetical protein B7494_g75 [Chlorociboria aeruginascens]
MDWDGMIGSSPCNLYVSSYGGDITTLQLNSDTTGKSSLKCLATNQGSMPNPSYLTLNNGVVYCVNEGLSTPQGSLASYKTSDSGVLTQIDTRAVLNGPVHIAVYGNGTALAVAHYGAGALTSWKILSTGGLQLMDTFNFTSPPGPVTTSQAGPHPHESIVDPTGAFLVVPDLGSDRLRVFRIDQTTSKLTQCTDYTGLAPGTGPRHGTFLQSGSNTYFFLTSELAGTMSAFQVTYSTAGLTFTSVFTSPIDGEGTPNGTFPSECILSPCQKYVLTSNRGDKKFQLNNYDPSNSTKITSDSLQSWIIDPATGKLTLNPLTPAGGSYPRMFSVNKDGTLAAVGLQNDQRVVIIQRDVQTGTFAQDILAEIDLPGQITSVIWAE